MTNPDQFRLIGFANPTGAIPGFVVPVFDDGGRKVVQDGRLDGTVTRFVEYDGDKDRIVSADQVVDLGRRSRYVGVGDDTRIGFLFADKSVHFGTRADLEQALATRFNELSNHPFVRLEVAEFVGDESEYHASVDAIAEFLTRDYGDRAGHWARNHLRLERLLPVAVHDLARRLEADIVTAFVYDEEAARFHLPVGWGLRDPETFADPSMLPRTGRIVGRVVRERQPVVASRVEGGPPMDGPFARRERIKSAAGFPLLLHKGEAVGAVFVSYRKPHDFGEHEVAKIKAAAGRLAVMVRERAAWETLRRSAPPTRPGTDEKLQAVLDLACDTINLPVAIWCRPAGSRHAVPVAGFGLTSRYWREAWGVGAKPDWHVRVAERTRPDAPIDLGTDPDYPFREAARAAGWRAAVVFPVSAHGSVCGVVEGLSFGPEVGGADQAVLRRLAGLAGAMIANDQRNREAVTLERIGPAILAQADDDKAMRVVAAAALELTGGLAAGVCSRGECHDPVTAADDGPSVAAADRDRIEVPVRTREELVTLFVEGRKSRLTAHHTELLQRLAEQASAALGGSRMLLNASTAIERASARVYSQDEVYRAVLDEVVRLGHPEFQLAALQLINDRERTIETVAADGVASVWEGLARHPLSDEPRLCDIQVDIALARPLRVEILDRADPRFDPWIFRRFRQETLTRVFVPLILARDAEGEPLAGNDLNAWLAGWQVGEWKDQPREDGRRQFTELNLPDRLADGRQVTWQVIGTVEAGYRYWRDHTIPRDRAVQLAQLAAAAADRLWRCQLPQVFDTVVEQAVRIVGARYAILRCDPLDGDEGVARFRYEAQSGQGAKDVGERGRPNPVFSAGPPQSGQGAKDVGELLPSRWDGIGQRAIRERRPVAIPGPEEDDRALAQEYPDLYAPGVRSVAAVPLPAIEPNQAAAGSGVLCVGFGNESGREDGKARRLTAEELGWLQLFSNSAADAIRHVTAYTRVRDRYRLLASLYEMARSLVGDPLDKELLWNIAHNALNILGADIVTIYEYLESTKAFVTPPHIAGRLMELPQMTTGIAPDDAPAVLVGRPVPEYAEDSRSNPILNPQRRRPPGKGLPFIEREGIISSAGFKLVAGRDQSEVVGVMFINYRRRHTFDQDEKRLIDVLASVAAMVIQNSRMMQRFLTTDRKLLTATSADAVLADVVQQARLDTGAEVAEVVLVNPFTGDLEPRTQSRGADEPEAVSERVRLAFARRVARGAAVLISDISTDPDLRMVAAGGGSALGVPLTDSEGKPFGVLVVFHARPGALNARGQTRLEALAVPAAVALLNDEARKQFQARGDISTLGWVASTLLHRLNGHIGVMRAWSGELTEAARRGSGGGDPASSGGLADFVGEQGGKFRRKADEMRHRIMDFARWAKRREKEGEAIDLATTVNQALIAAALPWNVQPKLQLPDTLPPIDGDEDLLHEIFLNLFHNAGSAMPEGGTLTITAAVKEFRNRPFVDVRVTDTGTGVSEESLRRFRLGQHVESKSGLGLGLHLAQTYIRDLGGFLDIRRRDDSQGGTEVVVVLPTREVKAQAPRA